MNTQEQQAQASAFEWIGGEARVKALTERFYDLMDLEPSYAALRTVHGSDLASAREKLFWFLCGWLGGPQHYTERFGHPRLRARHMPERASSKLEIPGPRLRARHMPFVIGIRERDQWLACMDQAMGETGVDEDLRARLRDSFFQTADWMRNTPG